MQIGSGSARSINAPGYNAIASSLIQLYRFAANNMFVYAATIAVCQSQSHAFASSVRHQRSICSAFSFNVRRQFNNNNSFAAVRSSVQRHHAIDHHNVTTPVSIVQPVQPFQSFAVAATVAAINAINHSNMQFSNITAILLRFSSFATTVQSFNASSSPRSSQRQQRSITLVRRHSICQFANHQSPPQSIICALYNAGYIQPLRDIYNIIIYNVSHDNAAMLICYRIVLFAIMRCRRRRHDSRYMHNIMIRITRLMRSML